MTTIARHVVPIAILDSQPGAARPEAPIHDVPTPAAVARIHDEPPMSAGARERYAQLRALAEARPAVTPRTHVAGQVETRWPTVEAAIAYRRWLEAELRELTRAERRALRLLQRDPRTREHPTRSIDFLRIGRAQEKRDRKAQRALENQRRSEAGRKARARQLARPAGSPAEPSAAADAPASDIQEVPCPE